MVNLRPGEVILRQAPAQSDGGVHAALSLTSERVLFSRTTEVRRGFHKEAHTVTISEVELSRLDGASVAKRLLSTPMLVVMSGGKRLQFKLASPEGWAAAIESARVASVQGRGSTGSPVVVNVQAPVSVPTRTIERQVVKVRCRYCGSLGDEISGKCASCGARL